MDRAAKLNAALRGNCDDAMKKRWMNGVKRSTTPVIWWRHRLTKTFNALSAVSAKSDKASISPG